jgi:hypothetical protein
MHAHMRGTELKGEEEEFRNVKKLSRRTCDT